MRTSDFSLPDSSSMVFHRPTGVAWALANKLAVARAANARVFLNMRVSFGVVVGNGNIKPERGRCP